MIRFAKEFPGALRKILIIEREYGCGAAEIAQKAPLSPLPHWNDNLISRPVYFTLFVGTEAES